MLTSSVEQCGSNISLRGCSNPVFVCGSPRSGTTFVWSCLSHLPALKPVNFVAKELPFFHFYLDQVIWGQKRHQSDLEKIFERKFIEYVNAFCSIYIGGRSGRYIMGHPINLFYVPSIRDVLPNARFIILSRHPEEVVWSMLNYKTAREAGWISTSAKEENFVDDVVRCFSIWDKYAEFVAWAERGDFGNSALVLRHEDLVKKPVAEYQRIIEHIDEEPGEKTLSMFANAIANSSFLEDQVSGQTFSEMKVDYRSLARSNSRFQKMCEIISGCSTRHVSVLGYQSYMAESVKLLAGAE